MNDQTHTLAQAELASRIISPDSFLADAAAFVDVRIPRSQGKLSYAFIGPGVSQNPDQTVNIDDPHGSMCDQRIFAHQLVHSAESEPSAVPDQNSIEAMADEVLRYAPDRFIPVGLSLGGIIAAEIAATAPGRVAGAVVADTNLALPSDAQVAIRRGWRDALADDFLNTIVGAGVDTLTADPMAHRELIIAMARDIGATTFAHQNEVLLERRDRRDDLRHVPTLIIVGALDGTCSPEILAELQERIDDAELVVIPDAGHLSRLDQPHQFTTAIDDWLSRR